MTRPTTPDKAASTAAGASTFDPRSAPTMAVPPSPPAAAFGRYVVEREIGAGGMGTVYLARDPKLNRPVAIKVPKPGVADNETFLRRFYREARSAAAVTHPNVCPVYEVGEAGGTHFIAMGYVEGNPLSAYVDEKKLLGPRQVAIVVRKVALALHEAHERGLVHRDLKPGNVMIDRRGEPVVMDFGLARPVECDADTRVTQDGRASGTVAYMPPEQFGGDESLLGPATDIYALGVSMFELLTGRLPFTGTGSITSVVSEVMTKPVPSPRDFRPDVPRELADVCVRAMAKRPEDRFASMKAMADELTRFLKGSGQKAASPGMPTAPMRPAAPAAAPPRRAVGVQPVPTKAGARRSNPTVALATIGVLAVGGIIVGAVWASSRPPAPQSRETPEATSARTVDGPPAESVVAAVPAGATPVEAGPVLSDVPFAPPAVAGPPPGEVPLGPPNDPSALSPEARRFADERLRDLDGDRDGRLTRQEARGLLQSEFDRFDADRNGLLEMPEIASAAPPGGGPGGEPPWDRRQPPPPPRFRGDGPRSQ